MNKTFRKYKYPRNPTIYETLLETIWYAALRKHIIFLSTTISQDSVEAIVS